MGDNWKDDIIKNKLGGKKDWTEAERLELCHQLDKNLNLPNDSIPDKISIPDNERWTEDNWKEKMGEHPVFSPFLQENADKGEIPVSDLGEGLAQLKYAPEHNSPSEVAQSYKEEGVHHFKYKKYRFSIASFSEGIKAKCPDQELNAQLHNNRAAAHFHLKNYRSAFKDCEKAIELKPDYMKAVQRGIQCASLISSWDEVIAFCDKGLLLQSSSDPELIKQRASAVKEKKVHDRDTRKKTLELKKKLEEDSRLLSEIAKRGIEVERNVAKEEEGEEDNPHHILLRDLEPSHMAAKDFRVHLNKEGELVWPVLLLYPEYEESDCILEFNENARFLDHLEEMFGSQTPPSWDSRQDYKPESLVLYFEDSVKSRLVNVSSVDSLKNTLSNRRYIVKGGMPKFIVLVKDSKFMKEYVSQYSVN